MENLPQHLRKYIVEQDYSKYTPIDHAVWRFILRQLKKFLKLNAHECYLEGLEKTGITEDRIPSIAELSKNLEKFGWRALPVSGFIPPAAFMELQSLSVLPIASDMRSLEHLLYTPAPDIVHEAAGHAPILIHPEFSNYLKKYAQVAKKALISKEDLELYEAIRVLSDIKENPLSTSEQIMIAEENLKAKSKAISHVSEASLLSRMNWWTAEYGLIGSLDKPKIFGAGLLSSVGESKWCLSDKVKKIPLSLDCLNYSYDITEPQPQLFVTPDFQTLIHVLEQMAETMAFKVGGIEGLRKAIQTEVVNTVEIDGHLQIGGCLEIFKLDNLQKKSTSVSFLKFKGPCQIAYLDKELPGHNKEYHAHGFSTPLGRIQGLDKNPQDITDSEWATLGFQLGSYIELNFESGFHVEGIYLGRTVLKNKTYILRFKEARALYQDEILFQPEWGYYDVILGEEITSVFSGPPDRFSYGETTDFQALRVPQPKYSVQQMQIQKLYEEVRFLRDNGQSGDILNKALVNMFNNIQNLSKEDWLLTLDMYELAHKRNLNMEIQSKFLEYLKTQSEKFPIHKSSIEDGLQLIASN